MQTKKPITRRQFLWASLAVAGGLSITALERSLAKANPTTANSSVYLPVSFQQYRSLLKGWQLNEFNTGLAGVGIDRSILPLYTGSDTPADGSVIREMRIEKQLNLSAGIV